MQISDHEEFGIKLNARPSSDSLTAVPIKKRRFLMAQSPSSPPHISSSPANCDVLQKSLKPESSVSETGSLSALETTLTSKGTCEYRAESIVSKDLSVSLKHEILPQSDHPGLRSNMTGRETSGVKELAPDNICVLFPVTGSTQLPSAQEPSELPLKKGSSEGKPAPKDLSAVPKILGNTDNQMTFNEPVGLLRDKQNSESFLVKQENLESCSWNHPLAETQQNLQSKSNDAEPEFDSANLCLNRSNWDLNTTMDTWEGLPSNSAVSSGTGGHDSLDLGGIHNKRLELGPLQMSCKESDVSDAALGKCMLEDGYHQPSSSNLLTSMNKGSTSEACLDLQLKPSFVVEPLFSLSVKPSLSNCIPTLVTCRDVKAERYEESCQTDNRKIEVCGVKSVVLKHVKSEPGERQDPPKSIVPNDLKSECSRAVKSEPLEDQSQGYLRRLDSLTPQPMEVPQNVTKLFSKAFDSLVPDGSVQHSDPQMPSLMIPVDPSQKVGGALGLVTQSLIPCSNEIHHGINSGISQYKKGTITETSDSVRESLVSEAKRLNLLEEAHKMTGLTSEFPSEPLLSDVKENMVLDCKFEVVAQMCCSENLSTVALVHELHKDTFETSKVTESSEGNIELSAEVLDKPCGHEKDSSGHEKDSNSFQDKAGSVDTVPKQFDEDDGYEDGEVKDLALHGIVEVPCKEIEENEVKGADSLFPVDGPIETSSHVDLKEDKIENQNELKIHGLESCDGGQCGHNDNPGISTTSNLHDTSADGVLTAVSSKRRVSKTICKLPLDLLKYKGPERKLKFDRTCTRTIAKGCHDEISNQQTNAPLLDKVSLSPKTIVSIKGDAKDHANDKGSCSRVVNLNPPPDGLACRKPQSIDGRLTSSRIEKEGLIEKSFRRDNSHFQRIRDEKYKYRSRIPEHVRIKGLPVGRRRSDLMHTRSRTDNQLNALQDLMHTRSRTDNQLNALHRDRNSDHEQVDGSAGAQFPRPINGSKVAPPVASDNSIGNAGRMARKLMVDELQNLSPMSCRRRSPGGRGQIPVGRMIRHPVGDISPNSYRREKPNLVLRSHEERAMRSLPDDMMVPPPVSRAYFQYERAEGSLIQRERRSLSPLVRRERSLSPMRRRVNPSQFPSICSGSSPGSQAHPYHQWSPPRRLPDGFNGSPEIMARAIRPDRMRSPHQRPCFAEDMIGRRRDSPPYITQMPDHLVDIGPSREQNFPRPVRGLQRNIRRFETIDPREISEEYFRSLPHNQFDELDADVECDVDRSFNERQERRAVGLSRSFRQRHTLSGNDNESFRPNVAGGPSGPFRSSHEGNEGFPERGSPRDYEGHIRNRLGGRLRGIEEQDGNYRYHGELGWRDAGITDLRPNRRRPERH